MTQHPSIDAYLRAVLFSYHRNRLPRNRLADYKQSRAEVIRFLQQAYPKNTVRADEPIPSGSYEKKTDINCRFDLDLVLPFRFGFMGGPKGMKNDLMKKLQSHYQHRDVRVRNGRYAVCLQILRGPDTIEVDVVPGMEKSLGDYKDGSTDDKDKNLVLYDRQENREITTNVHRQIRLIRDRCHAFLPAIKLLKIWKLRSGFKVSSYALELIVHEAVRKQKFQGKKSPTSILRHTLQYIIPKLRDEPDYPLQDLGANYIWESWLKAGGKQQMAAILNQMLSALNQKDPEALQQFFPRNTQFAK